MSSTKELARCSAPCHVEGLSDNTVASTVWFKTEPLNNTFCYRVAQLQLYTDSSDLGKVPDNSSASWSWFEVAIFSDAEATKPRVIDGKDLSWPSHHNSLGLKARSRHFGVVFDRRGDLLNAVEAGNVIAVRVCARYPGWVNDATSGHLVAKILNEDLFCPTFWTLTSSATPTFDIPDVMKSGVYTLGSTTECQVHAKGSTLASKIWFTSPPLDDDSVTKIEEVRLNTDSKGHGSSASPDAISWSWFDIVILESSLSTTPKVKDGRELVWFSHDNKSGQKDYVSQEGRIFGPDHVLLSSLQVGDVIAVRVCAQFPGWENHCRDGRLVVRINNNGPRPVPRGPPVDWSDISERISKLQGQLEKFLDNSTPDGVKPALSVETQLLSQPLRADQNYGVSDRPLRLLSLDGGGVRGISSLIVLQAIMSKVTDDPNPRPCDYFDMIAGTSSGGLIAIMLGRLRMTIQECIKTFFDVAKKTFNGDGLSKAWNLVTGGVRYNEKAFENALKDMVKGKLGDENAPLRSTGGGCKVFVVACRADNLNNQIATHLRTYDNPRLPESFSDCTIWQAARATCAAPTYFRRMKIGKCEYVDGGIGFNNPTLLLAAEALHMFGRARTIGCLLSIGTGMVPDLGLGDEAKGPFTALTATGQLVNALIALARNAEQTHHVAELLAVPGTYFRMNVGVKIADTSWLEINDPVFYKKWFGSKSSVDTVRHATQNWANLVIALDDYKSMDQFVALTKTYLEGQSEAISQCALGITAK